ncbi:MAG: alanine/glycine:cation symporter family protein [Armatimonadota bacterium]
MESLHNALGVLNSYLWGPPMLVLLFGTHLVLTFRLGFIQRYLPLAIRLSLRRGAEAEGDVSHFGALTTALAATIGTGNIIGVATAVSLGGPGAVLWMWLTGVFGIATKYAEALLSVKYRVRTQSGAMAGGPMYVLERGIGARWAGVLFAVFTAVAAFGIGNMVQANAVASMAAEITSDGRAAWVVGAVLMLLTGLTILGGIRSIARVCEILVPFMAAFYVLGCLLILAAGYRTLPATFALIVRMAFDPGAAAGGFLGGVIAGAARYGIARGLFSNESGLGSAPIVAAAARTRNPVRQALVSSTGTFWDTVVVCAMTGLVIVNAGHWKEGVEGVALARQAFAQLHDIGPLVLNAGLAIFVFSTILGWSYYGEKAVEYLFGSRAVLPYRVLWVCAVMAGSVTALPLVWEFADAANALMAIPNLASLLLLNGVIVAETRKYLWSGRIEEESQC